MNRCILCSLESLLLQGVGHVATSRKAVCQSGEVLVIVLDPKCRNRLVAELLELRSQLRISFRCKYLRWNPNGLDFLLVEQGGVGHRNTVYKWVALKSLISLYPEGFGCIGGSCR